MKVLELYAGTRSIGRAFERRGGHEVFSIDWDPDFADIDMVRDIGTLEAEDILSAFGRPDVVWASPDCTTYSVASLHVHRRKVGETLVPQTPYARQCDAGNRHLMRLIADLKPKVFFIENPRGCMRKMDFVRGLPRHSVTYCQYGDTRMKPTDIWTNAEGAEFRRCRNGDPCHVAAPRGSRTGTQGLDGPKERSRIPDALCDYIVELCEENIGRDLPAMEELNLYLRAVAEAEALF